MNDKKQNLRLPGPVSCPREILEALSSPMINHRGPEFKELLLKVTNMMQRLFMTDSDVYILTSSGSGAMEASIVNTLSPGDKVLATPIGAFGDRYAKIAESYGANVTRLESEWGTAVDPDSIRDALKGSPDISAVLVTHNETSTGVTNDLKAIAEIVKDEFGKLLLVDAISSFGCIPLPVDDWKCDVVSGGSQKGLTVPPGLSFLSFSEVAKQAQLTAKMPRFYFDLEMVRKSLERGMTPATPAISLFFALDLALSNILTLGVEQVFKRHVHIGDFTRRGIKDLGLSLLADESCASNTVTAVKVPEGINGKELIDLMRTDYQVVVAGGVGKLEGKVFRIGHMGDVTEGEIEDCLAALDSSLRTLGFTRS